MIGVFCVQIYRVAAILNFGNPIFKRKRSYDIMQPRTKKEVGSSAVGHAWTDRRTEFPTPRLLRNEERRAMITGSRGQRDVKLTRLVWGKPCCVVENWQTSAEDYFVSPQTNTSVSWLFTWTSIPLSDFKDFYAKEKDGCRKWECCSRRTKNTKYATFFVFFLPRWVYRSGCSRKRWPLCWSSSKNRDMGVIVCSDFTSIRFK